MSPKQLALQYDGASVPEAWWRELLAAIRELVDVAGAKEVAYRLDLRGSDLSNALAERERHELKLRHLLHLMALDKRHDLIRLLAGMAGFDLVPKKPLSAEDELARVKRAMERCLSPEMRAVLLREANRET